MVVAETLHGPAQRTPARPRMRRLLISLPNKVEKTPSINGITSREIEGLIPGHPPLMFRHHPRITLCPSPQVLIDLLQAAALIWAHEMGFHSSISLS